MIDFQVSQNLNLANKDAAFLKKLKSLKKLEVLVGIPEKKAPRKKGKMNNATLLYIHTKGSPLNNLPARPLIEPALAADDNAEKISEDLREVVKAILDGNENKAHRLMGITGQDAVNAIQDWFDDPRNGWEPNTDATVKRKLRKIKDLSKRKQAFTEYKEGIENINSILVDTGVLKRAITYVLREGM
jgi:hypothetical protein